MVCSWAFRVTAYAELAVTSNFSFLRGASHAEELVHRAKALGLSAIGIADHNTLAGVVRAHIAAKKWGIQLLVGARLVPTDGPDLIVYPKTKAAYGQLSQLLSQGKRAAPKGECFITCRDIIDQLDDHIFILVAPPLLTEQWKKEASQFVGSLNGKLYLGVRASFDGRNKERLARNAEWAAAKNLPLVAQNDVLYHVPDRRPLQDLLTCIREGCTVDDAGFRLEAHAERHLKPPEEMARLFRGYEEAIGCTSEIAKACSFSLSELSYQYPDEPVPEGKTPQQHLEETTWKGAEWRYPQGVPSQVQSLLRKELRLISKLRYAPYFLTVYDIVAWARKENILCQGRGSAANSAVCYCLGITSVDPNESSLLFERFLSEERKEPPDIDVDFEHERREEVIQYIYERYGRDRAALTATVICYRPRSAIREVCKALGLSEDVSAAMAGTVWGSWGRDVDAAQIHKAGVDPSNPMIRRAITLARQLIGFPRHLSQHVGGFVLTQGPLTATVPIGNAAMAERTFIEWDKDDIDALGIMKVDVLALGMLTCIRKCFDMLRLYKGLDFDLASIPQGDTATYDMLCRGDSLGVFQVESRAQMNMLPRLRPREFYDLVIEVAIVRPGPIQGDMVHPYLRRRQKIEAVEYPSPAPAHGPKDELERILKRTLGVPLFQEQAMQISIDAAKFTPEEANGLRRAMATFRKVGTIQDYETMMVSRMVRRGYDPLFAQRCFDQVKGFGEYGFPESHAASFALLVYASSWLKCHHPDIFCAALLNSQPMGFYAPAQIVRDAQEHDVEVQPPDVNLSDWDNILEPRGPDKWAVRLGLRQVDQLTEESIETLFEKRGSGYQNLSAIRRRTLMDRSMIEHLAAADAFRSLGLDRRAALWAVRGEASTKPLPLFAAADVADEGDDHSVQLPAMPLSEHVIQDYQATRLSLKNHPMAFLRRRYARMQVRTTKDACNAPSGTLLMVSGIVLIRQRPGSAKGVFFVTIEDETGVANLVVWPKIGAVYRPVLMGARILLVKGRVQRADNVTHIVADQLVDRTRDLELLSEDAQRAVFDGVLARADHGRSPLPAAGQTLEKRLSRLPEDDPLRHMLARPDEVRRPVPDTPQQPNLRTHPRNVRIIPKSRDFH